MLDPWLWRSKFELMYATNIYLAKMLQVYTLMSKSNNAIQLGKAIGEMNTFKS